MWNRLALVIGTLVSVIFPIQWYSGKSDELRSDLERMDQWCAQPGRTITDPTTFKTYTCEEARDLVSERGREALNEEFWIVFSMAVVMCFLVYGAIWLIVRTSQWVLAGRHATKDRPAP